MSASQAWLLLSSEISEVTSDSVVGLRKIEFEQVTVIKWQALALNGLIG